MDALATMLAELESLTVEAGELVIRQGDPAGPMYVVEEGRLRVFVKDEDGGRRYIRYLRRGDFFGELSLFRREVRSTTVEAVEHSRLLRLSDSTGMGCVIAPLSSPSGHLPLPVQFRG